MDIILDKLRDIEIRYRELEGLLSDPKIVSKQGLYQKYAKEHADLRELVETIRQYEKIRDQIEEYQGVLAEGDEELKAIVREEMPLLKQKQIDLEEKLNIFSCPRIPMMIKMSFWKSERAREATKRAFSPATCFACTLGMRKLRAGVWR